MPSNNLYLAHHGIKGQRWGVRRYQNPNGTLTPLGKQRLDELRKISDDVFAKKTNYQYSNSKVSDNFKKYLKDQGITKGNEYDIVSKTAAIGRYANSDEVLDSKRKYAFITDRDKSTYSDIMFMLGANMNKPVSEFMYEAKRDLKVANEQYVEKHVIQKYGNKKINELYNNAYNNMLTDYYLKDNVSLSRKDKKLLEYTQKGHEAVSEFLANKMKTHVNEIGDDLYKKGFDAMIDIEDSRFIANYPVVILNPKDSLKLKSKTEVWSGWNN